MMINNGTSTDTLKLMDKDIYLFQQTGKLLKNKKKIMTAYPASGGSCIKAD